MFRGIKTLARLIFNGIEHQAMSEQTPIEQLRAGLRDPDWRTRMQAAEDLGRLRDARALAALVEALSDSQINVRHAATAALGQLDDERAFDQILSQLEQHDNYMAASALGRRGDRRATAALVRQLSKGLAAGRLRTASDDAMCLRAALALGMLRDPTAVDILLRLADDEQYFMREAAAKALGEIADSR